MSRFWLPALGDGCSNMHIATPTCYHPSKPTHLGTWMFREMHDGRIQKIKSVPEGYSRPIQYVHFRTYAEKEYFTQRNEISAATIEICSGQNIVADASLCLCHQLHFNGFRYLDEWMIYWMIDVRHQWLMLAKYGLEISYQCTTSIDVGHVLH